MNGKWMKRALYGTVAAAALLAVTLVAAPGSAEAFGPGGGMRGGAGGGMGHGGFGGAVGERGADLAEALGISVEKLQEAMQKVAATRIDQAVEDGNMTQEQADLMKAGMKLRDYIDRHEILAGALGITVEELEAAMQDGTLRDLVDELGIDRETLQGKMQAATEAAIDQAVADGVITAEEAEALKEAKNGFGDRGGMKGMRGMRGGRCGERPGGGEPGEPGELPGRGGQRGGRGGFGSQNGEGVTVPSGTSL